MLKGTNEEFHFSLLHVFFMSSINAFHILWTHVNALYGDVKCVKTKYWIKRNIIIDTCATLSVYSNPDVHFIYLRNDVYENTFNPLYKRTRCHMLWIAILCHAIISILTKRINELLGIKITHGFERYFIDKIGDFFFPYSAFIPSNSNILVK